MFHPLIKQAALRLIAMSLSVLFILGGNFVTAMSSTNYRVENDTVSFGGGWSSSTNYQGTDTIGDLSVGEGMASANYKSCSGFECTQGANYISFSVQEGLSRPGTAGAGINFGTITTDAISSSNGSTINSVFVLAESSAQNGIQVTITSVNSGLKRASVPTAVIPSATATLSAGIAGYGICVTSATQHAQSPTAFVASNPYDGTCTTTTGHNVGIVDTTSRNILTSTGELKGGDAEILVKAAAADTTMNGNDYQDELTIIATGTY